MCRFKKAIFISSSLNILVSIHPMCRFKPNAILKYSIALGFNTSYVSVQANATFFILQTFLVSIHPMCRFKVAILSNIK